MSRTYDKAPEVGIDTNTSYRAVMETSEGTVTLELFAEQAPVTVNNFVFLAREGFYDDLTFHRVIGGFMIQGGDPEGTGRGAHPPERAPHHLRPGRRRLRRRGDHQQAVHRLLRPAQGRWPDRTGDDRRGLTGP
jgi:hypothetical protein